MSAVDSRRSGMNSTARSPSGASKRTASTRSPRCADTTNPPSSAADALSGWPSSAVASCELLSARSAAPPPSTWPANTPPTDAAADEPMPRDSGIRLCIAIRQPIDAGRGPIDASRAFSSPATNRLERTAGSSPSPSPVTVELDRRRRRRPPRRSRVLQTSSARPEAVVAGAEVRGGRRARRRPAAGRRAPPRPPRPAARPAAAAGWRSGPCPAASPPAEGPADAGDRRLGLEHLDGRAPPRRSCGSLRPLPVRTQTTSASGSTSPAVGGGDHARHGRRRRRLAEHALEARAARGRRARICSSVTAAMRPPDSSRAPIARSQDAGLPMRIAVAMVSGCSTGWPSDERRGAGGLEAPHPRRGRHPAGVAVLAEAAPVGADVAGVADRDRQDVRRPAQVVADLEGGRLLALEPERVDRVDERDRVVVLLRERADDAQRVVEVAADARRPARRRPAPGAACRRRSCRPAARRRTRGPAAAA